MDNYNNVEEILNLATRIRTRLEYGYCKEDILTEFGNSENVFLAYKAAEILFSDCKKNIAKFP